MASINTIVKRKQYLWLGIVVVGTASAIGGALYLSDVDMSGNGETVAEQEPVPDMTGVVDTTFDDKVRQHATTEMQVTAAQMQKQYEEIRRELDVLNKQRGDDQRRIEKLGQDNATLAEQVKALGANPVTATGEPVPQTPASPPGPEGEPQPGNTPVSFPPQGSVAVPPPTAFYPGNGVTPPPQVTYQSVPVPNRIQRKVFIGVLVVFFQHPGNVFRIVCQLTTTCDFIFALLFTLTPQNPGDNKEGNQANNQCHNCGQNECGP